MPAGAPAATLLGLLNELLGSQCGPGEQVGDGAVRPAASDAVEEALEVSVGVLVEQDAVECEGEQGSVALAGFDGPDEERVLPKQSDDTQQALDVPWQPYWSSAFGTGRGHSVLCEPAHYPKLTPSGYPYSVRSEFSKASVAPLCYALTGSVHSAFRVCLPLLDKLLYFLQDYLNWSGTRHQFDRSDSVH